MLLSRAVLGEAPSAEPVLCCTQGCHPPPAVPTFVGGVMACPCAPRRPSTVAVMAVLSALAGGDSIAAGWSSDWAGVARRQRASTVERCEAILRSAHITGRNSAAAEKRAGSWRLADRPAGMCVAASRRSLGDGGYDLALYIQISRDADAFAHPQTPRRLRLPHRRFNDSAMAAHTHGGVAEGLYR
jgi:hypothetical protein